MKNSQYKSINFFKSFIFIFITTGFITYTPDWSGYELAMDTGTIKDPFFYFLGNWLTSKNLGFRELNLIYKVINALFLAYLINEFKSKTLLISFLYIVVIFVAYVTQIRFFLGYTSVCLSFYFLYVKKKKILFAFFFIFGLMNHYSLILFIPFFFLFTVNIKRIYKWVLCLCFIILLIQRFANNIIGFLIPNSQHFFYYLKEDQTSSLLGGIYTILPFVISIVYMFFYVKAKIKLYPEILKDNTFCFLYRFSIIPFIYAGIALSIQIIGIRFIIPSILFQLLLLMHLSKYNNKVQNKKLYRWISCCFCFYIVYYYPLHTLLFGSSNYELILKMIGSISF